MQLKNAKVLVTGGSDGYGRGIAAVLKKAGAEVWITGRNVEKLEKAAEELGVRTIQADASSGADWDRVMRETGELDVLVNNAGFGGKIVPVAEQTDEDIIRTIGTNLTGVVLGCRRAGAMMAKRKRGIIINISSVCALYAWPAWSVYTAAKAGVAKFSHGLTPNCVRTESASPASHRHGDRPDSITRRTSAAHPRIRSSPQNALRRKSSETSSGASSNSPIIWRFRTSRSSR